MSRKYFWLKMPNNFCKRHDVRLLMAGKNGYAKALFYIQLLLESVDHGGRLRYNHELPYTIDDLSVITNIPVEIAKEAFDELIKRKLVVIDNDKTIVLPWALKRIGSETEWAEKKRTYRGQGEDIVQKPTGHCPTDIEIEIDKEIEKEKEKEEEPFFPGETTEEQFPEPVLPEDPFADAKPQDTPMPADQRIIHHEKTWKTCGLTPYDVLPMNMNGAIYRDIIGQLNTYGPEETDIAIKNFAEISLHPDQYELKVDFPTGFPGFLKSGIGTYRAAAKPLEKFRRNGKSPPRNGRPITAAEIRARRGKP